MKNFMDVFFIVLTIWTVFVVTFWPAFDFIQTKSGHIPPAKECDIEKIKAIYRKGYFYRYSAFKRFRTLTRLTLSQAIVEFGKQVKSA